MILKNLLLVLPSIVSSFFAKSVRTNLNEDVVKYIEENGLYHFTKDLDTANKIIESGMINPTKGYFSSYGKPAAFLFAGIPDLDTYLENLCSNPWDNILLHPEKVLYAIKLSPKANDLSNYKFRRKDGAIIAEGGCILNPNQVEIIELVLDYIPDKTGKKTLLIRERTKEEISHDTDIFMLHDEPIRVPGGKFHSNIPSKECMEAIRAERKKLGYVSSLDLLSTTAHIVDIERKESFNTIKSMATNFKSWFNNIIKGSNKALPYDKNEQLSYLVKGISNGTVSTQRPVLSKTYNSSILSLNKQGIYQKNVASTFDEIINSSFYQYATSKEKDIDLSKLYKSKTHGINHNRRVAILASEIMQSTGTNFDEKMSDILFTACYYHDIGRIADIGPHAKRSIKKLKDIDLSFVNGEKYSDEDRNILYAIVESHESKDTKFDKILTKYSIPQDKKDIVRFYASVLKDADALDRARLSSVSNMNLNPKYLRIKESKTLLNFSFDLNTISKSIDTKDLMQYDGFTKEEKSFSDRIKVENTPTINPEQLKDTEKNINKDEKYEKENKDNHSR